MIQSEKLLLHSVSHFILYTDQRHRQTHTVLGFTVILVIIIVLNVITIWILLPFWMAVYNCCSSKCVVCLTFYGYWRGHYDHIWIWGWSVPTKTYYKYSLGSCMNTHHLLRSTSLKIWDWIKQSTNISVCDSSTYGAPVHFSHTLHKVRQLETVLCSHRSDFHSPLVWKTCRSFTYAKHLCGSLMSCKEEGNEQSQWERTELRNQIKNK